MFDEELAKQNVEKKLAGYKQWKDEHGLEWVEVDGKKLPKRVLARFCMDIERRNQEEQSFGFLSF